MLRQVKFIIDMASATPPSIDKIAEQAKTEDAKALYRAYTNFNGASQVCWVSATPKCVPIF
jgi:hypothetical protein